jgi:hypothetical protein
MKKGKFWAEAAGIGLVVLSMIYFGTGLVRNASGFGV